MRGGRSHPTLELQARANCTVEGRGPACIRQRTHQQRLRATAERESLFLAEELQRERSTILEHRAWDGDGTGHQRENHLVGHEEIVRAASDVSGSRDPGRCRLGVAPHPVDDRGLQRGRAAELQPQIPGEPRGGNHVDLFTDVYGIGRND
jgi:hypothetical protein